MEETTKKKKKKKIIQNEEEERKNKVNDRHISLLSWVTGEAAAAKTVVLLSVFLSMSDVYNKHPHKSPTTL